MPFSPQPKVPGDLIKSTDWNESMTEIVRLEGAKLNITGGNISGPLAIGSGIGGGGQIPALRVNHNGAFAWGNALSIDQPVAGNNDGPKIRFQKTMAGVPAAKSWSAGIINGPTQGHFVIHEDTGAGFGTNRLTIAPGGNVGIGTSNPLELLQVGDRWTFHNGGAKVIGLNSTWNGASDVRIFNGGAAQLRFNVDGSLIIRNIPNGNAGTPATGSDIAFVDGNIRFDGSTARRIGGDLRGGQHAVVVGGNWDELEIKGRVLDWTGSNLHIGYENDHSGHGVYFGNGKLRDVNLQGTTNMEIPGGKLNFGSTVRQMVNLWSTGYGIGVQANTQYFRSDAHFAWYRGGVHHDDTYNPGAGGARMMSLNNGGSLELFGQAFKPGGGFWAAISDKKLKKNIKPLKNSLEKILKLRGVTFDWKSTESDGFNEGTQVGMIAQEVQEVIPEWVGEQTDGTKFIAPAGFEAYIIESIKALYEEIVAIKAQLSKK